MLLTTVLLVPGIIAMIYSSVTYANHAPMKVGIDYTGGTILQYGLEQKLGNSDVAKTRETLEKAGIENPYIQILNVNNDQQKNTKSNINSIISIRTKFIDKGSTDQDKITEQLKTEYTNPELISVSSVGPTMGKELFKNSLIAVTLAFLGIVAYLSFRFRFDYALAAILGVLHDVIFVCGMFSILGLVYNVQIDGLFITAILTVIGFSVHDTIVVFDRIRCFSKDRTGRKNSRCISVSDRLQRNSRSGGSCAVSGRKNPSVSASGCDGIVLLLDAGGKISER